jgi:hypothetical protein
MIMHESMMNAVAGMLVWGLDGGNLRALATAFERCMEVAGS